MTTARPHPFLTPLHADTACIVGDSDAALKVIQTNIETNSDIRTLRIRPEYAVFEIAKYTVKAYRQGLMARLSTLKYSSAGREWTVMNEAAARGIPIAIPVCVLAAGGFSYLVCETVQSAASLQDYLSDGNHDLRTRPEWVTEFAKFVASCHKAGLLFSYRPLANILVRESDRPAFFISELMNDELSKDVTEEKRLQHLAYLSQCFSQVDVVVQRRFFRRYVKLMNETAGEKMCARNVLAQSIQLQFELNSTRISACTTLSSSTAVVQRDGVQIALNRRAVSIDLRELERPISNAAGYDWETLLRERLSQAIGNERVWNIKCPIKFGGFSATRRRVDATWGKLLELDALRVSAPEPLAVIIEPDMVRVFGAVPGLLKTVEKKCMHDDLALFEDLAAQLIQMHRYGVFFLPVDADQLIQGLHYARNSRGSRVVVLTAPDHMFRGKPTTLGQQAVASLGRVGHTVMKYVGERQMKELIWGYARRLRLNQFDTDMLLNEARRNPTGQTLVMTQGLERGKGAV